MAKSKQKAVKTPKKRSTKYGKLAAVCAKELSAKKAALVRAEKALAKAQKQHTELLSEVARLDMLDRSLKALINGTEPPQNVKYVYSYPQWVWYGNPWGWYWNGYTWTLTAGQQNSNLQGNTFTWNNATSGSQFYNSVNTVPATLNGVGYGDQINTVVGDAPTLTTTAGPSGTVTFANTNSSGLIGYNSSGINLSNSGSIPSSGYTFTTPSIPSGPSADLTVDLSTGAADPEAEQPKAEAKDEKEEALPVGHGG